MVKKSTVQKTLSPLNGEETPRDVNKNGADKKVTLNASKSEKFRLHSHQQGG